jgi:DNA-binding MltR family transcriptional regulator
MGQDTEKFISDKFDVVMAFRHSVSQETDRGCALMAAEFLSNELGVLLRVHFVEDNKACDAVLDDPRGAVGTFSSRIEFAYLLGLIGPEERRELNLVRKIRNEFAHEYQPLDFTAEHVSSRCRELRVHTLVPEERPRANFVRNVMGLLAVIHGSTLETKHAKPDIDILSKLSSKELDALGEKTKQGTREIMSALGLDEKGVEQRNESRID